MHRRFLVALISGLATVAAVAPSVNALAYNAGAITGTVGAFGGPSGAEVVCHYNSAGRLSSMTVKPLTLNGAYDDPSFVGYLFKIRQATEFHTGRLVYKSPASRQMASKTVPSTFTKSRFVVTENLPGTAGYYVTPVMLFFVPGSRTTVEGKGVLLYNRYVQKMGTQSFGSNACTFDFGQTWTGE